MSMTEQNILQQIQPVVFDLYRDIHKGIRAELFAVTGSAGQLDASDRAGRADLARHIDSVRSLLVTHAEHEDTAIQPAVALHLPELAQRIEVEHEDLERRIAAIDMLAAATVEVATTGPTPRAEVHRIYLELAAFTGAYLAHQDVEERVVMPALEAAIGVEAVIGIHASILASLTPEETAVSLPLMFAAMNIDDRTELLGGMRANAPAEAFAGVWALVGSVLSACDRAALAARLGIE